MDHPERRSAPPVCHEQVVERKRAHEDLPQGDRSAYVLQMDELRHHVRRSLEDDELATCDRPRPGVAALCLEQDPYNDHNDADDDAKGEA